MSAEQGTRLGAGRSREVFLGSDQPVRHVSRSGDAAQKGSSRRDMRQRGANVSVPSPLSLLALSLQDSGRLGVCL